MKETNYSKSNLIVVALLGYALAALFIFNPEKVSILGIRMVGCLFLLKAFINTTNIKNNKEK